VGEGLEWVSPPTGEGSEQGAVPLPRIFFKFWFKMGHFSFKNFLCSGKAGHHPVPPPLNMPLLMTDCVYYKCQY